MLGNIYAYSRVAIFATIILAVFSIGNDASAQAKDKERNGLLGKIKVTYAYFTSNSPLIDGKLDDDCWQQAKIITSFLLVGQNKAPEAQTKAYILYDDHNLYIAFECSETETARIRKSVSRKYGEVWNDDCIEVFIAPEDNCKNNAYNHFVVNAISTTYDNLRGDRPSGKIGWNAISTIGTDKWCVEMVIPFADLNVRKPDDGASWSLNLCRERKGRNENSSWCSVTETFHETDKFGKLIFGKSNIEINEIERYKDKISLHLSNSTCKGKDITARLVLEDSAGEIVLSRDQNGKDIDKDHILHFPLGLTAPGNYQSKLSVFSGDSNKQYQSISYMFNLYSSGLNSTVWPAEDNNNTLYICSNTVQPFFIVMANYSEKTYEKVGLEIEIPEGFSLIDPKMRLDNYYKGYIDIKEFTREETQRGNRKYIKYVFWLQNKNLPRNLEKIPFHESLLLFLQVTDKTVQSSAIYDAYYRLIAVDEEEQEHLLKLAVLPAVRGMQPDKTSIEIATWACCTNLTEWSLLMESYRKVGVNGIDWSAWGIAPSYSAQARHKGMKLIFALYYFWNSREYVTKHPEHAAITINGSKSHEFHVCPQILIQNEGKVLKEISHYIFDICTETGVDSLNWDLEGPDPWSICFCSRCLNAFRDFAGISKEETLTPLLIKIKYQAQWIDFCSRQNTDICSVIRKELKLIRKDFEFGVYSSNSTAFAKERYRIDWEGLVKSKAIDRAYLSFYSSSPAMLDTQFGEILKHNLMFLRDNAAGPLSITTTLTAGYGRNQLAVKPAKLIKLQILKSIAHGANGINIWHWATLDGRHYQAIADATLLIAKFEKFFTAGKSDDGSVVLSGVDSISHAAWVKNDVRVIFVFNHDPDNLKTVTLKLAASQVNKDDVAIWDYTNKRFIDIDRSVISVPALDIAVLLVGPGKKISNMK